MPARMCLLCNALIHRYSSPHDLYKVTLAGGLRMMINLRSDKMAVPVAAAVDMPVAAARSFLFSARESVVGNLLNSSVQDWSCFLPSVRPSVRSFARSYVRRYISLYARGCRVRCGISFETCAACYSRRAAAAATDLATAAEAAPSPSLPCLSLCVH
jgi:hypothetical protein